MDDDAGAEQREFFDAVGSYHSRLFDTSAAYNQVMVLAGFAGYFAIWSAVAADMPRWIVLLCGGLMVVSLIVYVGWTVLSMILLRGQMARMQAEIAKGPDDFQARAAAAEAVGVRLSNKLLRFWMPVVIAAALPALISTVLLSAAAFVAVVDHASQGARN